MQEDKLVKTWNKQTANIKNCIIYCKYHKNHLTLKQTKLRGCMNKQCWYMVKLECKYWEEKERKKLEKKARKLENGIKSNK